MAEMVGVWTEEENDAIVADYFAMLVDDIAGRPYSKTEHNRLLQAIIGRPRGSIEYKHQNISAVLKGLGEDWIPGYKPAFNFQASLVDAVVRWLNRHPDWLVSTARMTMNPSPSALQEEAMLWIGPPPTHSNALRLMERMLAWNPNDNQGIRYLIGPEYLRAGETAKAERIFTDEAAHYPPFHYEHALLHLKAGNHVSAATKLRHGFVANGYVAEMLSGNPEPPALAIWHGSNLAEPETARDYLNQCGDLWQRTPDAMAFVRWLHTHPKVLAERAAVLECQEALLWEHDFEKRQMLGLKEEAARARIDDVLSAEIVRKKADRHGCPIQPWRYQRTRF